MITVHTANKQTHTLSAPALPCTLLSFLQSNGFHTNAPCGGSGRCGNCRVVATGDLSIPDAEETRLLDKDALEKGIRLACRTKLIGPHAEIRLINDTQVQTYSGLDPKLTPIHPLGTSISLAIDLGTTTITGALYDLKSGKLLAEKNVGNPQTVFGADVVSRLQAARTHAQALSDTVKNTIQKLTCDLLGIAKEKALPDAAVLTANTAMLCLLFGYPVRTLTRAPFSLPHAFGEIRPLSELLPDAKGSLLIPPCIGPFLGADIVTALLDTALTHATSPAALIDLGTNGEIALFDGSRLLCCSTAAGPAFEGAGIRMGCSAVTGAIDRIELHNGRLQCYTVNNGPAAGLCGSGLLDAIACLLDLGAIDASGRLLEGNGESIRLGDTEISLWQQDLRAVQTAKAAIRAGLETLCNAANTPTPDLLLAGGFGSALNLHSAARIGLVPKDALHRTRSVGNTALSGAAKLLADKDLLSECHRIAQRAEIIDLANNPAFTERYFHQMQF